MHFHLADRYRAGSSQIHHLDPRAKFLIVTAFILGLGLTPPGAWLPFAVDFLLLVVASAASGLGAGFALRRSFVALPFVLAALALPFTVPGPALFTLPVLGWTASLPGSVRFASILLRTWLAVQAAILLTATTPFPDMLWAMARLKLPGPLVAVIGFMYRYLFLTGNEALRMLRARAARSARSVGGKRLSVVWQGKVAGSMVGSLFLRSIERSERVYDAMLSRGYDGQVRTLTPFHIRRLDATALAAALIVVGGLVAWSWWA